MGANSCCLQQSLKKRFKYQEHFCCQQTHLFPFLLYVSYLVSILVMVACQETQYFSLLSMQLQGRISLAQVQSVRGVKSCDSLTLLDWWMASVQIQLHQPQTAYFTFKVLIFCTDINEVLLLLLSLPLKHFEGLKQSDIASQILLVQHSLVFKCNLSF